MTTSSKLLTADLAAICLVAFVSACNLTVFYNLFPYLQTLGIPMELRGLVIGSYAFTSMLLYLFASPFLHAAHAPRAIIAGMAVMTLCGVSYFFVESFWGLLGVRVLNGAANFLAGAAVMSLFSSRSSLRRESVRHSPCIPLRFFFPSDLCRRSWMHWLPLYRHRRMDTP